MITINANTAAIAAQGGIDFEAYIRGEFLVGTEGGGFPTFDNSSAFAGEEMFIGYGTGAASKYVTMHGNVSYNFGTHTVAGVANTIEYGTRGEGSFDANGYFVGGDAALTISGLNLINPIPLNSSEEADFETNGAIHNFATGHMYGAEGAGTRLDTYADALDYAAQKFLGSAGDDIYTGTSYNDDIRGNGGADTFSTGGGHDTIHGGAGVDTLVLTGNRADYSIIKVGNTYTIVDQRTGELAVDGSADVTSVENFQFADGTVRSRDIDSNERMITIDASAMSGVNFDTFIADYFAGLTSGSYKFYGGSVDSLPGGRPGYLNGSQIAYNYKEGSVDTSDRLLFEGENLAYDYFHHGAQYGHGLSGQMDSWTFGQWVDGQTTGTQGTGPSGAIQGLMEQLKITGFDLNVPVGTGTSSILNTLWTAAQARDSATLNNFVDSYAQHFVGSNGADTYTGGAKNDVIEGKGGDDILDGGAGADIMKGGAGNDTYYVDNINDRVIERGNDANDVVITSVDFKLADEQRIEVIRGAGTDGLSLTGNMFANVIIGTDGDDIIAGGSGRDTLTGGEGADAFVFGSKGMAVDTITDFTVGEDEIHLSRDYFQMLRGEVPEGAFVIGSQAHDANDRVIYNANNGSLFWDSNGNAEGGRVKLAVLEAGLDLTHSDFFIV
jgi:hypothetical protein